MSKANRQVDQSGAVTRNKQRCGDFGESWVEQLFAHSEGPLCLLDLEGRLRRVTPAVAALAGQEIDELLGRPFQHLLGLPYHALFDRRLRLLLRGDEDRAHFPVRLQSRSGSGPAFELLLTCLEQEGRPAGALASLREREGNWNSGAHYSRQFASAVEKTTDTVIVTNREGIIEHVNPAFEAITGYSRDEVLGKSPRILKSGRHGSSFYKHLWGTILSGETFRHLIVNQRKNGELLYEEQTITPVSGRDGEISHFVATGRDVTLEQHQQREQEALIRLSRRLRMSRTRTQVLPIILQEVRGVLEAEASAFVRTSTFGLECELEQASGNWAELEAERLAPLVDATARVIDSAHPCSWFDLERILGSEVRRIEEIWVTAAIPLFVQETPLGVLWLGSRQDISEQDLQLILSLHDLIASSLHRSTLHEQTEQRLRRLTALHAIDKAITSGVDLRLSLNILLGHVVAQLNVDAAAILLVNPDTCTMDFVAGRGFDSDRIRSETLPVGAGFVGQAVLQRETIKVPHLLENQQKMIRRSLPELGAFAGYYVTPLIVKERVEGVLEVFLREPMSAEPEWLDFLVALATQAAIAIDNATMLDNLKHSNAELERAYNATIVGWARALELRDAETQGHAMRVTETTLHLARSIGVPAFKMEHIRRGALLHDIGKLGIPDSILYKTGPLSPEEWNIMKRHPEYANRMLSHVEYLRPTLNIPYCHHERWDGTGYPRGLGQNSIPEEARIFAVIDVWDALRSDRPYRKAWTDERILEYVEGMRERQFDPRVVDAFCSEFETIIQIAEKNSPPLQGGLNAPRELALPEPSR